MDLNFRGRHDATKNNYVKKDVVSYQTNTSSPITFHVCLTDHNTPQIPSQIGDTQFWGLLNTSSNFPNSIDSFLYRANVQVTDKADINRINELQKKPSLSVDEQNELNALMTKHRNKFFLAEDINALQQSVSNMQLFFKDNIDAKLQDYNNQITQNKDDALTAIEKKKENIIEYMDGATAGQIRNDMGVMGELTTTDKSSLVNAINEVNAKEVDLTPIENSIGNKALLETDNKENLVNAINEVNSKPSIHVGVEAPTKGEFWLDGNEKLKYKNDTNEWKGVAPSQIEFDNHNSDNNKHFTIEEKKKLGNTLELSDGKFSIKYSGDLNDLPRTGFYSCDSLNTTNLPINNSSNGRPWFVIMTNDKETSGAKQIASQSISDEEFYYRTRTIVGTWLPWRKLIDNKNINDSTSPIYIYVDGTNGQDTPDNGSSTNPVKTIQYAVDRIKKLNVGFVNIKVTDGIYPESVAISDHIGSRIDLSSRNTSNPSVTVNNIYFTNCSSVGVRNFTFTGMLSASRCTLCEFDNIKKTTGGSTGLYATFSDVYLTNSVFSNCNIGISATILSNVNLNNVSGSGNNVGIDCYGATVRKSGSVAITGSTPQVISGGGQILA